VAAFDALLSGELAKLAAAARAVGGPVQAATELLEKAFRAERTVVAAVAACKQPQAPALQKLVSPVGAAIVESACRAATQRLSAANATALTLERA
jgi:adenylyl cyclase-associated protein